jgi:predicted TIM-barrel fold metal-dependent hydrolase
MSTSFDEDPGMIIDSHAHLVAPPSLYAHRSNLSVAGGQHGDPYRASVNDADLEKAFGAERPGSGGGPDPVTGKPLDDLKPVIESIAALSEADRTGVFEGNARRLFNRLDL